MRRNIDAARGDSWPTHARRPQRFTLPQESTARVLERRFLSGSAKRDQTGLVALALVILRARLPLGELVLADILADVGNAYVDADVALFAGGAIRVLHADALAGGDVIDRSCTARAALRIDQAFAVDTDRRGCEAGSHRRRRSGTGAAPCTVARPQVWLCIC